MKRIAIPSFVVVLATLAVFALGSTPARADMAPDPIAEVSISGSVDGDALVFRLTNTGATPVELGQPRLVRMDRGVRVPLHVTALTLDGAAHGTYDPFTVAPGATVVLRVRLEARATGELELRFLRGNVLPYHMRA